MKSDIQIAQEAQMLPIAEVGAQIGLSEEALETYGKYKAKVDLNQLQHLQRKAKLVLVSAINPTPAGEGKTTTSIGLADALHRLGKKAVLALREPSLGPVFGLKGGAAGGGYAQVLPMEDINLHFTGDFHAIGAANNLLAAMLDNHIQQGNALGIDPRRIVWKRAVDMNDRALRHTVIGLGSPIDGVPREDSFQITVASEIMAIFCLSQNVTDLKERLSRIIVAYTRDRKPITAHDLKAEGAMCALLKDALRPNLVQTIEHTPAFIHGGPFANIAHGCNSVLATECAMKLGDYAITEAGFGADLGAEKFYNIKCRTAGLQPALTVLVATLGGLKMHGGVDEKDLKTQNIEGVRHGLANLDRHIENLKSFGQTVVVAFNRFATDTEEEIALVREHCHAAGVGFAVNTAFGEGGAGAEELARLVVETIEQKPSLPLQFTYPLTASIEEKATAIAQRIYGARSIHFSVKAQRQLERIDRHGWSKFPVCIAKTQYSFSDDPTAYGSVRDFDLEVRDVVINTGAEMIVLVLGTLVRMPGLPRVPQAEKIDFIDGHIEGLS